MKWFVLLSVVVLANMSSQASWLMWQIDQSFTTKNTGATLTYDTDYYGARMYAKNGSGTISVLKTVDIETGITGTDVADEVAGDYGENYAINLADLGNDLSGYSFYIEYIKWDGVYSGTAEQVAVGEATTYSDLANAGYVLSELGDLPTATVTWHGGPMNAPEPTSALLMMLGVAALGLRRKQRKLA